MYVARGAFLYKQQALGIWYKVNVPEPPHDLLMSLKTEEREDEDG